jgi:KDO2-lipid IV(A) lauroyltransferase
VARLYAARWIDGIIRRRPWVLRLVWRLEAVLPGLLWATMSLLPVDRASALGARLFGAIGPRLRRSGPIRANLEIAFPELDAARREALLAGIWRETGRVVAEYSHLPGIRLDGPGSRLEVIGDGALTRLRGRGTPTIFVTAHLANWEVAASAAVQLGFPLSVITTSQANPVVHRLWQRRRERLGWRFIHKDVSPFALARELAGGRNLGVLLDHRVNGDAFVPFFGVAAETTLVPALLAVRHGLDLTPVRVERRGGARFRVTFCEPIGPDPAADGAAPRDQAWGMTRRLFGVFEGWIREQPDAWLCHKRRWPKTARSPGAKDAAVDSLAGRPPAGPHSPAPDRARLARAGRSSRPAAVRCRSRPPGP